MELPTSVARISDLVILDVCGSTNSELVALAKGGDLPDLAVLVTGNQTAGRGRLGRAWVAPPGKTVAISMLLRPALPAGEPLALEHYGWLPLLAGAAMTRAIKPIVPTHSVGLKWPNDVQVDGKKVSGLLGELLPGGLGMVMGAGVNLTMGEDELPTATSTSLSLCDSAVAAGELADAVLSGYFSEFSALYADFLRARGDAGESAVAEVVSGLCTTLAQEVRVQLPGGDDLIGTALGLDASGRLRVRRSQDSMIVAVAAGDVTHLRYE